MKYVRLMLMIVWLPITGCDLNSTVSLSGELEKWHPVTLTIAGPETSENGNPNPFLDYRLEVTFTHDTLRYVMPGYYAADGSADHTSADSGSSWRVHFTPDAEGVWEYGVSFRAGSQIAIDHDPRAGTPLEPDGLTGRFRIRPTDKSGRDHRGKGMLRYIGERYLQFAGTGEYFIKGGADSPENFLAYVDFDGTYDTQELHREGEARGEKFLHTYAPHLQDWQTDDPTWKDGRGKSIIGALNYLSAKGMNSVYFITYNLDGGDGKDVWPWTSPDERLRFDCSKLDQWEMVFSHMDRLGIMLHFLTQETENDQGLDGGELGIQRKLYYREMIARYAHHLALVWNLGEENTNTDAQRKAFAAYFKENDPYGHPVVVHTFPGKYDEVYTPLLGYADFDGPSLQMNETGSDTHAETLKWVRQSAEAGHPWFVSLDEYGHGANGAKPDSEDTTHDEARINNLWGNLMAGGAGVEWYFGYTSSHNDLNCEDWRSRDQLWDQTRYALEFFQASLPFAEMVPDDDLVSRGWCLAKPGDTYAVYLPEGGRTSLKLTEGVYTVHWYNPRKGGALETGSATKVSGPGEVNLGRPPFEDTQDWVALVRRMNRGASTNAHAMARRR